MIISIGLDQIDIIDLERKIEFRSRSIIFANNSSDWLKIQKIEFFLKKDKRIHVIRKKKAQYLSDFLVSEIDPGSGISDPG